MLNRLGVTTVFALGALAAAMGEWATATEGDEVAGSTKGLMIQCPYLPPDLEEVPLCMGRPATCVGTPGDDIL